MPTNQSFEEFSYTLPPNRQLLASKLLGKDWFKNTDIELQKQILTLPQDYEGYVYDLSNRPDKFCGTTALRLIKLLLGNYFITSIFEIEQNNSKKLSTYEFVSWKSGSRPGIKGTLFIEIGGQIKYFIVKRAVKFAVSDKVFDSVGGLIQFTGTSLMNLPEKFEGEIIDLLGIDSLKISRFINLGKFYPDAGMANHHIPLFAAIIDGSDSKILKNSTAKKQNSNIEIVPIEKLQEFILSNEDGFFLATIARLIAKGIIKLTNL